MGAELEFRVRWVSETGSTNADLLAAAMLGEEAGAVLVADHQRAGRGRRGRSWLAAPKAGLLFSVLIRPNLTPENAPLITTALALGAVDACDQLAGVRPGVKWPNDLVIGERKLAGVLAESLLVEGRLEAVVAGMGINVRAGAAPPDITAASVSLDEAAARDKRDGPKSPIDRRELLAATLDRFSMWLAGIDAAEGRAALMGAARRESATLGQRVAVELDHGVLEGEAVELDDTGALLVADGSARHRVTVGDVVHSRRA